MHDLKSGNDATKDGMFLVQPGRHGSSDEELRAVSVWTGVGHAESVRSIESVEGEKSQWCARGEGVEEMKRTCHA
jgi:hypothetical protein